MHIKKRGNPAAGAVGLPQRSGICCGTRQAECPHWISCAYTIHHLPGRMPAKKGSRENFFGAFPKGPVCDMIDRIIRAGEVTAMTYEMVREILNSCPNNQMRDVFFQEVETENPEAYVRGMLRGREVEIWSEAGSDGTVVVRAVCDGLNQRFLFTPD